MTNSKKLQKRRHPQSKLEKCKTVAAKKSRVIDFCASVTLVLLSVFCTVGAVIRAFSFYVSLWSMFVIWTVVAAILSVIAELWRVKGIAAFSLIFLTIAFFMRESIAEGGRWALYFISSELSDWINIAVLFTDAQEPAAGTGIFFTAFGIFLAILLSIAICLYRSASLTALLTLPFVLLTFIVTSLAPDHSFIFGLIAVYLAMIISSSLQREDVEKRGLAFFPALAVSVIILLSAYFIAPQDSTLDDELREGLTLAIDQRIRGFTSQAGISAARGGGTSLGWPFATGAGGGGGWGFDTSNVAVADAGPRTILDRELLSVTASESGVFYLRGYSVQNFDGRSWYVTGDDYDYLRRVDDDTARASAAFIAYTHSQHFPESSQTVVEMSVDVKGDFSNLDYLPYYSIDWDRYNHWYVYDQDSAAQNDYPQSNELIHVRGSLIGLADELFAGSPEYRLSYRSSTANVPLAEYTQVDEETAYWLLWLAAEAGISVDAERSVIVDQVAAYIRSAAEYSLSPGRTPANDDFVRYFLETSQEGYCIHFATAATLMLRSFDIPARFTSGFLVVIPARSVGEPVSVSDRYAHAWVEVFYDDIGWIPLEVTPSTAESTIPAVQSPHTQTPERPETEAQTPEEETERQTADADRETPRPEENGTETAATQQAEQQAEAETQAFAYIVPILIVIAGIAASAAGIFALTLLRRRMARKSQERKRAREDNNAAVISMWNYICRLSGKHKPDKEIEKIAQKARFSQHKISDEELNTVRTYSKTLLADLKSTRNFLGRLRLVCIRALFNLSKFI